MRSGASRNVYLRADSIMQHSTKDAKSEILNETHLKESSEQERLSRLGHLSERELVQPIESNMLDARAHYSSSSGSLSSHTFGRLDQRTNGPANQDLSDKHLS